MIQKLTLATTLALATSPAFAQWMHNEKGGAFDGKMTHIALTVSGDYGFGLRCTTAEDLSVVFITPEQAEPETVEAINGSLPDILVRVDDNEIVTLNAKGDTTSNRLAFIAMTTSDLAEQVIGASRKVSIAMKMLGTLYHESEFNVIGSTKAVQELTDGCGLQD